MILYPAIDLKDGRCVRLRQGALDSATIYEDEPAAQARRFAAAGATHLHVIDLDGAVAGRAINAEAVERILAETELQVQLGGGIRALTALARWLEAGVARVVLGTLAARRPDVLAEACARFPGRIAVAIDAEDGRLRVAGWTQAEALSLLDLARRAEAAGAAALIHTDIGRDGMLAGANIEATAALARQVALPVILSGGVTGLEDIRAAKAAGLAGCILGRALYEGRIDLHEALALC